MVNGHFNDILPVQKVDEEDDEDVVCLVEEEQEGIRNLSQVMETKLN